MSNYSIDEWGSPVIGGAISVYGDVAANNVLGGKYVVFYLNPRLVLYERIYGVHPSIAVDMVRTITEAATVLDVKSIGIVAYVLEEISLVEANINVVLDIVKTEAATFAENVYRDVYVYVPIEDLNIGETLLRDAIAYISEIVSTADIRGISEIFTFKTEIATLGNIYSVMFGRVLSESIRIRDLINNSFIPLITGIDEWGNPIVGIISSYGDVVYNCISGGKDFVVKKTSWVELGEVVSMYQVYKIDLVREVAEVLSLLDGRIIEVARAPIVEIVYTRNVFSNYIEAVRLEVLGIADYMGERSIERIFPEVMGIADSVHRVFSRYHEEIIDIVDSHLLYPRKYIRDVIFVDESRIGHPLKFLSEMIVGTEDRKVTFYFSEIATLVDVRIAHTRKVFSEIIEAIDAYYRTQFLYESTVLSDDVSAAFTKFIIEVVDIAESYRVAFTRAELIRAAETRWAHAVRHLGESFVPADRRVRARPLHYIENIVHATDLTYKAYITRTLVDAVAGVDSVLRNVTSQKTEKTTILVMRGGSNITKYVSETISAMDSLIGRSFAFLSEKIYTADSKMNIVFAYIWNVVKFKDTKFKHIHSYLIEIPRVLDTKISHPLISLLESLIHTDSRSTRLQNIKSESIRTLDRKYKHAQVEVINIISFFEGKYISYTRILNEHFPLIESRYAMANHYIIDRIKIKDSKLSHPLVYANELLNIIESKTLTFYKTEIAILGDSIARRFTRHLTDFVSTRDRIRKNVQRLLSESGTFNDVMSRGNISRILTENAAMLDTKVYSLLRYLSERIQNIDSKLSRSMKYISLENVFASDTRYARPSKILAEATSIIDSYSRRMDTFCQERIRVIDVRNSRIVFAISDLLKTGDIITPAVRKMLVDAVTVLDVYTQSLTKFLTDDVRALQRIVKRPSLDRVEILTLSDVGVRVTLRRVLSDALTAGDSLARTLSVIKTEALIVADRKRKEYTSILVEHLHASETIRSFKSLFRKRGSDVIQTNKHRSGKISASSETEVIQTTLQKEIDNDED
jgi:hypothetical protein